MRFLSLFSFALSVILISASHVKDNLNILEKRAAACPYPAVQSQLATCKTGAKFCSSFLGRGPATTTIVVATATVTEPVTTFTYLQESIRTRYTTVTQPTLTLTSTYIKCVSSTATAGGAPAIKVAPTAVAAAASCGVGAYSSAWVSTACECDFDTTVYRASATKTVSSGTSLLQTTATTTTTFTSYIHSATRTVTTTSLATNCYPPANATCLNPGGCDSEFYFFFCGSNHEYTCSCGLDSHNLTACFNYFETTCSTTNKCYQDYDCAAGYFCLQDWCSGCYDGETYGACAKADVCLGDVVSAVTPTYTFDAAAATAKVRRG